jgi:hypothetical protein
MDEDVESGSGRQLGLRRGTGMMERND